MSSARGSRRGRQTGGLAGVTQQCIPQFLNVYRDMASRTILPQLKGDPGPTPSERQKRVQLFLFDA